MTDVPAADRLTLEQQVSLLSGGDFWHTQALPEVGIRAVRMSDGPHGIRRQDADGDHLGINSSKHATCFPPAVTLGSSWHEDLVIEAGAALGREARFVVDAVVDERTLREIYLSGFEYAVTTSDPWVVMAAYNLVNDTHATEHRFLLTDILRGEWGFTDLVVSDWGRSATG